MNTKGRFSFILTLLLLPGLALVAVSGAAPAQGGAPTVVSYQGEVRVGGAPYTGLGYFKLAVVDAAGTTSYWSNDGTSSGGGEPTNALKLEVSQGLFSVLLGDTTLDGMTQALTADVFAEPDRYLRVWFSTSGESGTFSPLTPDTRIAAVPYALQAQEAVDADTVDGLHASQLGAHYQNVVVVAKSGGDYTSVQAAIDSIADATAGNPYLVWVAPGLYMEQVTMKAHVHLQGAGQEATIIRSATSSDTYPPGQATLKLASDTSLRDLTVENVGAGDQNAALLAMEGTAGTLLADLTVRAQGIGTFDSGSYGIFLYGIGTEVTLQQVTALAENGSGSNHSLIIYQGPAVTVYGGSFTARGGKYAGSIYNYGSSTALEAVGVTALGENGSASSIGLVNSFAAATVRGGSFTGHGGPTAQGIRNAYDGARLEAVGVSALAEDGSGDNMGLNNARGVATLRGGSFTARGGTDTYGIYNEDGATLDAEGINALGEGGTGNNHGLYHGSGEAVTLGGGSFTGRGGEVTYGIYNYGADTTLEAVGVTALGEGGAYSNDGLCNWSSGAATLSGGSFTARGGTYGNGIENSGTLEAEGVTALATDATGMNCGLYNRDGGGATLRGGSFTGDGGGNTLGIYNDGGGTTLDAKNITALGKEGQGQNYGLFSRAATATADSSQFSGDSNYALYQDFGTVHLGVTQLDGGATRDSGTLTCFQVYDGNYAAYTCP